MARQISRNVIPRLMGPQSLIVAPKRRLFSSNKAQLIEVELESSDSVGGGEIDVVGGLKRLEDAIHTIIVRRLEPEWLPLRPGSSYWVPPRRATAEGIVDFVGKLTNPLSEEESLSLTSSRGWPSSNFFFQQGPPPVVEVHVCTQKAEKESLSEGED